MHNDDYGVEPSLRFGIGTPTQITLSALLMHNNDMPTPVGAGAKN